MTKDFLVKHMARHISGIAFFMLLLMSSIVLGQTTLFLETAGSPAVSTAYPINTYSFWTNGIGCVMTGTGYIDGSGTPFATSGDYAGASGDGPVMLLSKSSAFAGGLEQNWKISNVNTSDYNTLVLSFGLYKKLSGANGSNFVAEISSDGVSFTPLAIVPLPTGGGSSGWYYCTATGIIPSTSNLSIRFRNTSAVASEDYRLDDVKLTGTLSCTPSISIGGMVSTAATVCPAANGATLTLSGQTGTVTGWESSLDNFATAGTAIANTTINLAYSNITQTTSYRALVKNGTCSTVYSTSVTITVSGGSVGGSISPAGTVCSGANGGTMTLTGQTGTITGWELSLDNFTTAGTPFANITNSYNYANLTQTTSYRSVVKNGSCASVNSSSVTIIVSPLTVAGVVNSSASVCSGANGATINLTGANGNVIGWESSLDNFATGGTPIANTTTSQSYTNLTLTTSFRAIVQSGSCASAITPSVNIAVNALPSAPTAVPGSRCGSGSVNLNAMGSPSTYNWYDASSGGTLLIASSASYTPTISSTTIFYVAAVNAGCESLRTGVTGTVVAVPGLVLIPASGLIAKYNFNGNANDLSGNGNNGNLMNAPSLVDDRFGNSNSAYSLNGTNQYITSTTMYTNPANFTLAIWFKTTTSTGGKIIGFGNVQTGTSFNDDRHIYMSNSGQLFFGVYPGTVKILNTASSYNDGVWHHAVVSLSFIDGMKLYVDGTLLASDATVKTAENYSGYWRIGYDKCSAWPSLPSSFYFNGSVDDAFIYNRELTASEVTGLYQGANYNLPLCNGATLNLSAGTLAGATYTWTGPNSFSSIQQNPTIPIVTSSDQGVYSVYATVNGCNSPTSNVDVVVNSLPPAPTGTPGSSCGTGTVNLNATGSPSTYNWYDASSGGSLLLAASPTYTTPSISSTNTYYVASVSVQNCESASRTALVATINTIPSAPTTISGSTCGSGTVSLSATGSSSTYNWYSLSSGGASLGTLATFITPVISTNITYYVTSVDVNGCESTTRDSVLAIVISPSIGGTVSSASVVCSGANTGTLTLTGNTGTVTGWEFSLDNFATAGIPIVNTTTSLTYLNLSQTTSYRAIVQNGSCVSANSLPVTITVTPVSVGGSVNSSATVCSGTNGATLSLTGETGSVMGWEFSLDNFATLGTPIVNTTTSLAYLNLTQTTSYRAVVQNGSCISSNSSAVTITVASGSVGGIVNSPATVCLGLNGATINLTGETGNVIGWESSLDNFATVGTPIVNTTTSLAYLNLTQTTSYRAIVQNGSCVSANSSLATITVIPGSVGGTVNSSATVCSGTNGATLNLTGESGSVIGWESSLDNFATVGTAISNAMPSLGYSNLTQTTSFRAIIQNGSCASVNSASVTIVVTTDPSVSTGTLQSSVTVVNGKNGGKLTLTGYTGTILNWESSVDNFSNTAAIVNITDSLVYNNVTLTTYYRVVLQGLICPLLYSNIVTVTVKDSIEGLMIYPSLSPNDDNVNDEWVIDNITKYPNNHVTIFDRWGNIVFKEKGYNNTNMVWKGQANSGISLGNKELPDGTYYYLVDLGDGNKARSGYVVIKR